MSDEIGNVLMHLGIEKGKVVICFAEPQSRITFDPANVEVIAMKMVDLAFEAHHGLKPVGDNLKADLIQRHRERLNSRLSLILNSTREDKLKSNGQLSIELVDVCLHEIFS